MERRGRRRSVEDIVLGDINRLIRTLSSDRYVQEVVSEDVPQEPLSISALGVLYIEKPFHGGLKCNFASRVHDHGIPNKAEELHRRLLMRAREIRTDRIPFSVIPFADLLRDAERKGTKIVAAVALYERIGAEGDIVGLIFPKSFVEYCGSREGALEVAKSLISGITWK